VKLSVLAAAFLSVLFIWLVAFGIAFFHSPGNASDHEESYNLLISIGLIAAATFTGGLWTTLLLRQLAAAFWLTLLVPTVLSAIAGVFLADSQSVSLVVAVLSIVIGSYSIAGFLFARWLFFRAQDVGWSGGVIAMPEWTFLSARAGAAGDVRSRKPVFALMKKELLLQQGVLTGAFGLLVLHAGVIGWRIFHTFPKDSVGEALTSIVWVLWVIPPALMGSIAMAEERKLGVMEGQLCLPVSRRRQFLVKLGMTLGLGIMLGGVVPVLLESTGLALGSRSPAFMADIHHPVDKDRLCLILYAAMVFSAWVTLVYFFASSLTKNFLQAVGTALVTFIGLAMCIPLFTNEHMMFYDSIAPHSILPLVVAVPTLIVILVWLAYLNFKNFRDGWPLWRRNLLGALGAVLFIGLGSATIYHRAWEVFEPAEPAHGPARLSLANPPELRNEAYDNLVVHLPDGRVWFDFLSNHVARSLALRDLWSLVNPLPRSAGPQRFLSGSNWLEATARHVDEQVDTGERGSRTTAHITGYAESAGIQQDGTLWASEMSAPNTWTADHPTRFGQATNWQQVVRGFDPTSVLLLKKDGTLWRWGTNHFNLAGWPQNWPGLRSFEPYQIGTDSDWSGIYWLHGFLARKTDGSAWHVRPDKDGKERLAHDPIYEPIVSQKFSGDGFGDWLAYVRHDGTLWLSGQLQDYKREPLLETLQSGRDTNWVSVARNWHYMAAIKSDGTLWQWTRHDNHSRAEDFTAPPLRLGIHHDWVAVTSVENGMVSLAADGSLWFWPDPRDYDYSQILVRLPKQPQFIGNVFNGAK